MKFISNLKKVKYMKEELKRIALELREWAEKYNKDYVTMAYVNGSTTAWLDTNDADYNECDLFIMNDEER